MQRKLDRVFTARDTLEGAGVRLRRGFSHAEVARFDPFLLFDDFSSNIPEHYRAGFPWHPHRGMETVTYILNGSVRHRDSLGNEGVIENGSVQWMTAGSGIIHEEMPESVHGIRGFQLWVNLPRARKMLPPNYQDLAGKTMPDVALGKAAQARVIMGELSGMRGPLTSVAGDPLYADITLLPQGAVSIAVPYGHTAFVYVVEGVAAAAGDDTFYPAGSILLFERAGDELALVAGRDGARLLLIAGAPLMEPIAWHGPIVMNTDEELKEAFRELQEGTFIRH